MLLLERREFGPTRGWGLLECPALTQEGRGRDFVSGHSHRHVRMHREG